jgi:hypothetical protein
VFHSLIHPIVDLEPLSPHFNSILIQARHLKSQVFHYETTFVNNDNTPQIYVASNNKELPIVINTGASNSITPIASDFTSEISKADLQELKQVMAQLLSMDRG